MRVPAACIMKVAILDRCAKALGGEAYGESKVEGDEEDGEPEVEGVVQVVVVDDDRGGEHDPDRDDGRGRQLVLWLWLRRGRGCGQRTAAAATDVDIVRDVYFRFRRVEEVAGGGLVDVDGTTAILEEFFGGHLGEEGQARTKKRLGWGEGEKDGEGRAIKERGRNGQSKGAEGKPALTASARPLERCKPRRSSLRQDLRHSLPPTTEFASPFLSTSRPSSKQVSNGKPTGLRRSYAFSFNRPLCTILSCPLKRSRSARPPRWTRHRRASFLP